MFCLYKDAFSFSCVCVCVCVQHCWGCPSGDGQHQQHQAEPWGGATSHVDWRHWGGESGHAVTHKAELDKYSIGVWWSNVNTSHSVKALFFQENMDMYSRVKRRKSMRRSTFSLPTHHKVMSKTEQEEEEEEGTEGQFPANALLMNQWSEGKIMKNLWRDTW